MCLHEWYFLSFLISNWFSLSKVLIDLVYPFYLRLIFSVANLWSISSLFDSTGQYWKSHFLSGLVLVRQTIIDTFSSRTIDQKLLISSNPGHPTAINLRSLMPIEVWIKFAYRLSPLGSSLTLLRGYLPHLSSFWRTLYSALVGALKPVSWVLTHLISLGISYCCSASERWYNLSQDTSWFLISMTPPPFGLSWIKITGPIISGNTYWVTG